MLDPGNEVIVMQPAMPSLHEIPRAIGCKVVPWKLEAADAFPKLLGDRLVSDFCERCIKDAGLMIIPDRLFSVNLNRFRIGFGRDTFGRGLAKFSHFVDDYMRRNNE